MSDVNKQLLNALKDLVSIVEIHSEATDNNFAWAELLDARQAIAAAEQAQQSVEPCFVCGTAVYYKQHSDQDCACRDEFNGSAVLCQKCLASMRRDQSTATTKP